MERRNRGGFTVMEMTVTLVVVSVIAMAVAGVSVALSNAQNHGRRLDEGVQVGRGTAQHLASILRKAKLVTGATDTSVCLWAGDFNGDDKINRNELILLNYDTAAQEIRECRIEYPSTMSPSDLSALNTEVALDSVAGGVAGATALITGDAYRNVLTVAGDVTSVQFQTDVDPPMTTRVNAKFVVGQGAHAVTVRTAIRLRAEETRYVGLSNGDYVLNIDRPCDPAHYGATAGP